MRLSIHSQLSSCCSLQLSFSSLGALLLPLYPLPSPADSPFPPPLSLPLTYCNTFLLSTAAHTIASENQMWRPPVLLLLKSPHNGAQGYLKLSVKTASRSFTPPHTIVMDVFTDCLIRRALLETGVSYSAFWARVECCFRQERKR